MGFREFMNEEKVINRWMVVCIFITGAFAGALLAVMFSFFGL